MIYLSLKYLVIIKKTLKNDQDLNNNGAHKIDTTIKRHFLFIMSEA